jgi:hypothetical protein
VFAVVFLAGAPQRIAASGGASLFVLFAGVMAAGSIASFLAFPTATESETSTHTRASAPWPKAVWFGIVGISCPLTKPQEVD